MKIRDDEITPQQQLKCGINKTREIEREREINVNEKEKERSPNRQRERDMTIFHDGS